MRKIEKVLVPPCGARGPRVPEGSSHHRCGLPEGHEGKHRCGGANCKKQWADSYNDRFIEEFERRAVAEYRECSRDSTLTHVNMALMHALKYFHKKAELPSMYDKGDFHKLLRQADITDSGDTDMVLWHLLHASKLFWEMTVPRKVKK